MPTLHTATEETKIIIKWGAIFIAVIILALTIFRIGKNLKDYFYPTPPPPPTVLFGRLPKIEFPQNEYHNEFKYTLNTLLGTLPALPERINVYPIINPPLNLLATKRAYEKALKIGFRGEGKALSNLLYEWTDQKLPGRKLIINASSFNFSLSSDFFSNPPNGKNLPSESESIEIAKSFLQNIGSFPYDIDESKTKTTLLTIKDNVISLASSFSSAKTIRVDFFQKDKDNLPILYPNFFFSPSFVLIEGDNKEIIAANFYHYDIDSPSATYPIKTTNEAFNELKNGRAYISSYYGNKDEVLIDKISLAYYLGGNNQNYLMPIIVFQGDNGFSAYVSAIKEQWIIK